MKHLIFSIIFSLSSFLFSQDKIITLSGAEYEGTYLGFKDGKVEFLQTGNVIPALVPKRNIKKIILSNGQLIDGSVDAIGVPNASTSESNVESVNNLFELRNNVVNNKQSGLQKNKIKAQYASGALIAASALIRLYLYNRECEECSLDELERHLDQQKLLGNIESLTLLLAGMLFLLE